MVEIYGADQFFSMYCHLFAKSLELKRPDFITRFLPQSDVGLRKSGKESKLLQMALSDEKCGSIAASKVINSCWCRFLARKPTDTTDIIYNEPEEFLLQPEDMLLLAEKSPAEFEKLVCSAKLIPAKLGSQSLSYWDEVEEVMKIWTAPLKRVEDATEDKGGDDEDIGEQTTVMMWLPLADLYCLEMMQVISLMHTTTYSLY
jgi:hypothetical protein